LSLGVGGSVCIFNRWDWCVDKGDVLIKHANSFSFKHCSLITSSCEICHCCITWHFWLVGETCFSGVVVIVEGTLDKGNHFLNRLSKISLE
jgi:hypothetical protein